MQSVPLSRCPSGIQLLLPLCPTAPLSIAKRSHCSTIILPRYFTAPLPQCHCHTIHRPTAEQPHSSTTTAPQLHRSTAPLPLSYCVSLCPTRYHIYITLPAFSLTSILSAQLWLLSHCILSRYSYLNKEICGSKRNKRYDSTGLLSDT
jgi:hypothetical protein